MTNNTNPNTPQLPVEVVEQIKKDAEQYGNKSFMGKNFITPHAIRVEHYTAGASEYATKLHQVEQENTKLRRWKIEAVELVAPIHSYVHKHIGNSLGQCSVKLVLERCKHFEQSLALLETVLVLLPGTSKIHEQIQTFLDGTK
jgi:hypothetical protein